MEQCENHSLKEHFPQAPQKTFLSGDGCLLAKNHANDFVSNLGGSLGLFVGFSFYNFIAELLGKCMEKVIKN